MEEIYQWANPVLVWLGRATEQSDRAFFMMRWTTLMDTPRRIFWPTIRGAVMGAFSKYYGRLDPKWADKPKETPYLTEARANFAEDQRDVLSRQWFFRAWTFQELVLAVNPVLLCGSSEIAWIDFVSALDIKIPDIFAASVAYTASTVWMNIPRPIEWNGRAIRAPILPPCGPALLRKKANRKSVTDAEGGKQSPPPEPDTRFSFRAYLKTRRCRRVSDASDTVYCHSSYTASIPILAAWFLMLIMPWVAAIIVIYAPLMKIRDRLQYAGFISSLVLFSFFVGGDTWLDPSYVYASRATSATGSAPARAAVADRRLTVTGILYDACAVSFPSFAVVDEAEITPGLDPASPAGQTILALHTWIARTCRDIRVDAALDSTPKAIATALMGGELGDVQDEAARQTEEQEFSEWYRVFSDACAAGARGDDAAVVDAAAAAMAANERARGYFVRCCGKLAGKRGLFLTAKRYIGTGPVEMLGSEAGGEGDVIVLVAGAATPLVLRSRGNGEYSVVGPALIPGVMEGEAWEREGGEKVAQDIVLV
ncbi:hypothetical protein C8A05DRAFT_38946 [Staphylotrichum tortipilum]|uniref:Heterokaryon incompatibility domain-containing protein n=1 Tax=Staphylotrichum tortipilum TaxID=2831512 RepID=A0AAN6MCL4_9PEZI|nr:hypothetical protein C8A05DRAFT_38946 [Staphylotrichum longicolle]